MTQISRFFHPCALAAACLVFNGVAAAGDVYYYRTKPQPQPVLSAKSKKAIARALSGEDNVQAKKNAKSSNAHNQAKAQTERYRLRQEQKMTEHLEEAHASGQMPGYMARAMQAYQYTGDRNVKRFAEAVSEFQKQELRAMAMENVHDPEKFNRYMAILSGKQYAPYSSIRDSGYVVNKGTGEISVGNPRTAGMHDKKVRADTARKNASASSQQLRAKAYAERTAAGTAKGAVRGKTAAAPGMTQAEYSAARARAADAGRPDLVKELDEVAQKTGLARP